MKTDVKNVRLILSDVQGGANTDLIEYLEVDPFDRNAGYVIRAIEVNFDPTDMADIAADASLRLQVFASSDAVPTGEYALGEKHIIMEEGFALPLTTSGVGRIPTRHVWVPPDGVDIIVGAEYLGFILATAGFTSALLAQVVMYGDAVTLTADEIATSRLRFS